jgi:hypothetical protein
MENHHPGDKFACQECPKEYGTAEGLRLHIRNHHDIDKKWMCHDPACMEERRFVRQVSCMV